MTANSQRGVALLTILLLVVSITVVAGAMLASQKIAIRRSGLLFEQNQLLQDIHAGQQLAVTLLRADDALNETDSEQDIWAQSIPPYTLDGHSISIEVRDEASRFNINNLYRDGAVDGTALAVFQRLLVQLNLAPEIAIAVLDYQDSDSTVYQDGGDEGVVYGQQSRGASSTLPNQPFVSVEQLQDIEKVSAEDLAALRPYITVVPYYLPININTARPVLLAALTETADRQQMQALVDMRGQQALAAIDALWQLPALGTVSADERRALTPLLATESQAFMALITAADTGAEKQRFATILISKTPANAANSSGGNNEGVASETDKIAKHIQVVAQRLWAFRPSF
ncbi:MAG: type II secretion system minor pseudopilin GspK [Psychrobacter sp.]|nr:type II secretion system minor pseudopilin GspK [Psychrobacter sp.]